MALQSSFSTIRTSRDWERFFQEELKLPHETAESYGNELASQDITGVNISVGLAEPGFLDQFNMKIGHQLELKTRFRASVKTEFASTPSRPFNKVPLPTVKMNITLLEFEQFKFEWGKYKEHYQICQNVATSLFFCCNEEVRQQIRIIQSAQNLIWTEQSLMDAIKTTVLSRTSSIIHRKQFLEIKQEVNETVQNYLQRLQLKASCCEFSCPSCKCNIMEERVKEKFILGLKNTLIQRSALKTESVKPGTPLSEILTEALTIEQSIRDQESLTTSSETDVVCSMDETGSEGSINTVNFKSKQTSACTHCGASDHTSLERRDKCPAWGKRCSNCQTLHHFQRMCLKPKRSKQHNYKKSINSAEAFIIGEIGEVSSIQLPVNMKATTSQSFQSVDVFPDTGANICLMGPLQLKQLRLKQQDLNSCTNKIAVAGGTSITATGWISVEVILGDCSTTAKVYYSKRVSRFFLSRKCCQDLRIIFSQTLFPTHRLEKTFLAYLLQSRNKTHQQMVLT